MELPLTKTRKIGDDNPKFLVIYGKPKSGKSTLISFLDDCLVVDFDKGADQLEVASITINNYSEVKELIGLLSKKNPDGTYVKRYKYIVLDTATEMEEILIPAAAMLYKATPMGKDFKGDVRTLPNGGGYYYIREAFMAVLNAFANLTDHLILLGHTKDKQINRDGRELSEMTLDLSGKLERLVMAKSHANALLYREKNKTILSFKGGEDSITEARAKHLRGKEIVMMESDENGDIKSANWDKIFIQ